jgi:putative spermidine/putrescine transport system ATP-binding protein
VPDGTEAVVTAIEYQGAHVALTSRITGDQDVLALIPEAAFFADPRNLGDTVSLAWDETKAHRLLG